jgi:hypothetical protein
MDEQGPDEQFEATDYNENGNIKLPPPPLAAEKPKRPTVAGLKKDIEDIESYIENEILAWLGELAARLEKLEEGSLSDRADVAADIAARLDNQDAAIGALADALRTYGEGIADWGSRMEECEDSILSLRTTNVDIQESAKHTELEFAQPPVQPALGAVQPSSIAAVASVCQTMNDVLMICRTLKEVVELSDAERNEILHIACRASGVVITPGLQIRAGVKFTGA